MLPDPEAAFPRDDRRRHAVGNPCDRGRRIVLLHHRRTFEIILGPSGIRSWKCHLDFFDRKSRFLPWDDLTIHQDVITYFLATTHKFCCTFRRGG